MGKAVFCIMLQGYHTPEKNISTETFQTEHFITCNKPPYLATMTVLKTLQRVALPVLSLIYWVTLGHCVFREIVS